MKRFRWFLYIIAIFLPLFFLSCSAEKKEEPSAGIKKPEQAAPALQQPETGEEKKEEAAVEAHPSANRNPFFSYLAIEAKKGERIKTPLECCELSVFKVVAILSGTKESRALIAAPDGKTYSTKNGDRIGLRNGRVVEVGKRSVIVEEMELDDNGEVVYREKIELSLPEEEKMMR